MSNRRVVVTGIGLVSSLGIGTDVNWRGLVAGTPGIGRITRFDVSNYAAQIAASANTALATETLRRRAGPAAAPAGPDLRPRVWFNPELESRNFIVPGIMAVIMGLIAALLTALTVAREWERGTMEQLISTPVRPAEIIFGKLLPYAVIGMANMAVAITIFHSVWASPPEIMRLMPMTTGYMLSLVVTSKGHRYWFHP